MPTTLDLQFNGSNGSTTIPDADPNHTASAINGAHLSTAFAYAGASSLALLTDGDCVVVDSVGGDWGLGYDDFDVTFHWRPGALPPDTTGTWLEGGYYELFKLFQNAEGLTTLCVGVCLDSGGTQVNFAFWFEDQVPYVTGAVTLPLNAWNTVQLVRVSGTTSLKFNGTTQASTTDARWVQNGNVGTATIGNNFLIEETAIQYALGHIDALTMVSRDSHFIAGGDTSDVSDGSAILEAGDAYALTGASTSTVANAISSSTAVALAQAANDIQANATLVAGTPAALTGASTSTVAHALTASVSTSATLPHAVVALQANSAYIEREIGPLDLADCSMYGHAPLLATAAGLVQKKVGITANPFGGKSVSTVLPHAVSVMTPHSLLLSRARDLTGAVSAFSQGAVDPKRRLVGPASRDLVAGSISSGKVQPAFGAFNQITPGAITASRQVALTQATYAATAGAMLAGAETLQYAPLLEDTVRVSAQRSDRVLQGDS